MCTGNHRSDDAVGVVTFDNVLLGVVADGVENQPTTLRGGTFITPLHSQMAAIRRFHEDFLEGDGVGGEVLVCTNRHSCCCDLHGVACGGIDVFKGCRQFLGGEGMVIAGTIIAANGPALNVHACRSRPGNLQSVVANPENLQIFSINNIACNMLYGVCTAQIQLLYGLDGEGVLLAHSQAGQGDHVSGEIYGTCRLTGCLIGNLPLVGIGALHGKAEDDRAVFGAGCCNEVGNHRLRCGGVGFHRFTQKLMETCDPDLQSVGCAGLQTLKGGRAVDDGAAHGIAVNIRAENSQLFISDFGVQRHSQVAFGAGKNDIVDDLQVIIFIEKEAAQQKCRNHGNGHQDNSQQAIGLFSRFFTFGIFLGACVVGCIFGFDGRFCRKLGFRRNGLFRNDKFNLRNFDDRSGKLVGDKVISLRKDIRNIVVFFGRSRLVDDSFFVRNFTLLRIFGRVSVDGFVCDLHIGIFGRQLLGLFGSVFFVRHGH